MVVINVKCDFEGRVKKEQVEHGNLSCRECYLYRLTVAPERPDNLDMLALD